VSGGLMLYYDTIFFLFYYFCINVIEFDLSFVTRSYGGRAVKYYMLYCASSMLFPVIWSHFYLFSPLSIFTHRSVRLLQLCEIKGTTLGTRLCPRLLRHKLRHKLDHLILQLDTIAQLASLLRHSRRTNILNSTTLASRLTYTLS